MQISLHYYASRARVRDDWSYPMNHTNDKRTQIQGRRKQSSRTRARAPSKTRRQRAMRLGQRTLRQRGAPSSNIHPNSALSVMPNSATRVQAQVLESSAEIGRAHV